MAVEVEHAAGPGLKELFALINLLILVFIIYFAGRRGIKAMLASRSKDIERKIIDAKTELERIKLETDRARTEIAKIGETKERFLNEIQEEGKKLYDSMVKDAKESSARILADAKLAAETEVQGAAARMRDQVVSKAIAQVKESVANPKELTLRDQLHHKLFAKLAEEIKSLPGERKNGV